uniref:amidohydrolase family protein n=1 Tax=uncultured Sphingomonas sp. TaxID=158754 RepID=UPI0035CC3C7F
MHKYLIAAATLLAATALTPAAAETFAIQAGHLIVDAAKPARGASTVIVTDGRITAIENGATAPAGATVVDLRNRTVLPGLIDVHVHLTSNAGEPWYQGLTPKYSEPYAATIGLKNALITARAGFTTVRDLGGAPAASVAMRDAVAEGSFPGPRILVAGPALSIIGGHGDETVGLNPDLRAAIDASGAQFWVCTGPLECAKAVRRIAAYGSTLSSSMPPAACSTMARSGSNSISPTRK